MTDPVLPPPSNIRLLCKLLSSPSRLEALRRVAAEPGIQTQQLNKSYNGPLYARELEQLGLVRVRGKSGRERLCHPASASLPLARTLLALAHPKKLSRILKLPHCLAALRMLHMAGGRLRQDYLYAEIWEKESGWKHCLGECHLLYQSEAVLHTWQHRGGNKTAYLWLNPQYTWLAEWIFGTRAVRKTKTDNWAHRGGRQTADAVKVA